MKKVIKLEAWDTKEKQGVVFYPEGRPAFGRTWERATEFDIIKEVEIEERSMVLFIKNGTIKMEPFFRAYPKGFEEEDCTQYVPVMPGEVVVTRESLGKAWDEQFEDEERYGSSFNFSATPLLIQAKDCSHFNRICTALGLDSK